MHIGNYEILSRIEEGGMGVVYYGKHKTLNREVAIKKLHSNLTNNPQFRERFINEAVILAKLSNPYIVNIYDLLEHEGEYYIIMEYVKGHSISDIAGNVNVQMPIERKLNIFKKILLGVDYAHENGIIHRDIKPSNILLDENDNPKILDFGIAKLIDADHSMTKTGMKMGSVYYMSPEQVLGQDINRQSDVYSLGVFLYELLTGSLPYSVNTESEYQIMESIVKQPIEEQRLQGLDESLKHIIYRATSKDQYYRFATCREFYEALETGVVSESSGYITPPSNQNSGSFAATRIMAPGAGKTQMMGQPAVQSGIEQKRSKKGVTILASVFGVLLIGTILIYYFTNIADSEERESQRQVVEEKKQELEKKEKELKEKESTLIKDNSNEIKNIESERASVRQVVASWLACWQTRDLDCYKSYITNDYVFAPSNAPSQSYSTRLSTISRHFRTRKWINISYSDFDIKINNNNATVSYYQNYSSDEYSDYGYKTIFLKKVNDSWKIYRDTFKP